MQALVTKLVYYLTPFIPPLLKRRGGRHFREGRSPSLTYTPLPLLREGGGGIGLLNNISQSFLAPAPLFALTMCFLIALARPQITSVVGGGNIEYQTYLGVHQPGTDTSLNFI